MFRPVRLRCGGEFAARASFQRPVVTACAHPSAVPRLQEFVFGAVTEWLRIYNIYLYCGLWVLNGLLQSAVWPCVVAVMGNWFGKSGCVRLTLRVSFGFE